MRWANPSQNGHYSNTLLSSRITHWSMCHLYTWPNTAMVIIQKSMRCITFNGGEKYLILVGVSEWRRRVGWVCLYGYLYGLFIWLFIWFVYMVHLTSCFVNQLQVGKDLEESGHVLFQGIIPEELRKTTKNLPRPSFKQEIFREKVKSVITWANLIGSLVGEDNIKNYLLGSSDCFCEGDNGSSSSINVCDFLTGLKIVSFYWRTLDSLALPDFVCTRF